jgi:hypothetical protein
LPKNADDAPTERPWIAAADPLCLKLLARDWANLPLADRHALGQAIGDALNRLDVNRIVRQAPTQE